MNVEVENLPNCLASLRVELPPERVTKEWNDVVKGFQEVARIRGFRPGKAPQNVVESKFRKEIQEELTRKLVNESTKEAIREKGLRVLSVSNVEDVEFTPERSMRFTATVITSPQFALPEYKAIPDAPKRLGSGKDFWVKLQEDSLLPGFGAAVVGMQIGERREFELKPPEDFPVKPLQDRVIHFQVELKAIKQMELPELNDEFAAQIAPGVSLDRLRGQLRERLTEQKTEEIERAKRNKIVDYLTQRVECELPQSYVKDETRRIMSEIVEQNQLRGVSEDALRESGKEIMNVASRSAKDRLKASFILTRIGEVEKIEVTGPELKRRVESLAAQHGMAYEKVMSELDKKGAIPQLVDEIQVGKVLDFLTSNANVETSSELDLNR